MATITFSPLLESLGWALIHSTWQLSLVALMVYWFNVQTSGRRADLRFSIAFSGLLGGLLAFVLTFLLYWQDALPETLTMGGLFQTVPLTDVDPEMVTESEAGALLTTPCSWRQLFDSSTPYISLLWALGLLWYSLRYGIAWWWVQRLRRRGLSNIPADWEDFFAELVIDSGCRRQVAIYESTHVRDPLTIGWWKPLVLVPAGFFLQLSPAEAEAVLLHEIAHIRRHDYLIHLLQVAVKGIFFYHPGIYYLARCMDAEREHACDDLVIQQTGDPKSLAKALGFLKLNAFHHQNAFAMHAVKQDQPFVARLKRLMEVPVGKRSEGSVRLLMPLLLLLAATVFLAFRPQSTLSVTDGLPEPAPLAVLADTLPDESPEPIIETSPEPTPIPSPEPAAFPEPAVAPSPEPAASPFPAPAPVIEPRIGIIRGQGVAVSPISGIEPVLATRSLLAVDSTDRPESQGVVTAGVVGTSTASLFAGSSVEGTSPARVSIFAESQSAESIFSAPAISGTYSAAEINGFEGSMGRLKRELLRNLSQDDLIENRRTKTLIEYSGTQIIVNGGALNGELYEKYRAIFRSYNIEPLPLRQIRISPDYIMVGIYDEDGFHGRIQGSVDLSEDIH